MLRRSGHYYLFKYFVMGYTVLQKFVISLTNIFRHADIAETSIAATVCSEVGFASDLNDTYQNGMILALRPSAQSPYHTMPCWYWQGYATLINTSEANL